MEKVNGQDLPIDYIPILIQFAVAAGFGITTIIATHLLGPKVRTENKLSSFQACVEVIGNESQAFSVKSFMVGILFVIFDVEVIFMYPWVVNFSEMGVDGLWKMGIFLAVVIAGLIYEAKPRALDWD